MPGHPELEMTKAEEAELHSWRQRLPYRDWYAVKVAGEPAVCIHGKANAMRYAKKKVQAGGSAAVYK
jgi:hypothetical protein